MKNWRFVLAVAALALGAAAISGVSGHSSPAPVQSAATSQASGESQPQLVLLDTDIGDDIDDAFALALALRSPELHLLGVTTAYGDTELRARLLDRYLAAVSRTDIPVFAGVPTSHTNVFSQAAYASQASGAHAVPKHPEAVRFLLDQIRAHPGEITLIAIGPLFNIQAAIERDPTTFRQLKRVVLMGGSIHRGYDGNNGERRPPDAEWNINRDPAGLKALLASGVPVFMMPLDSTQIHLQIKERELIFSHGSPLTDQLTLLYHQWMAGSQGHPTTPTLFDPVAVAYAIRPELCPVTPMRLEVDDKGFTRPVDGALNAHVCLQSDEKAFLELLLARITSDPATATPITPVSAN
jgi:inosine-uridine nucleoside N-ribohydrolase